MEGRMAHARRVCSMSIYGRTLNLRVRTVETQLAASQRANAPNYPSAFQEVILQGHRVLQPCMWDWILETTEPPPQRDLISRFAKLMAFHQGWDLLGGWREGPRYWWALKGMGWVVRSDNLSTAGLFYFFGCSRVEFDALPENVRNNAWHEAVRRVTNALRDHKTSEFHMYRPDDARSLTAASAKCNLSQLLRPYIPSGKEQSNGSKEAFVAWLNAEYARQHAKKG
jgi:hypothetical protein